MSLQLVMAAVELPLSWDDEVKSHLRLNSEDERARVEAITIPSAGQWVEDFTNRALVNRTLKLFLDHFPGYSYPGCCEGRGSCYWPYAWPYATWPYATSLSAKPLYIPYPPLQSLTHIKYYDGDGVLQTWSPTLYDVDPAAGSPFLDTCQPWRVYPKYGQSWPTHRAQRNAIEVQFVAGYGATAAAIPAKLRSAMLLMVGEMFERREQAVVGSMVSDAKVTAERLAWPFRVDILGGAA